jgi:hypothetical protein
MFPDKQENNNYKLETKLETKEKQNNFQQQEPVSQSITELPRFNQN